MTEFASGYSALFFDGSNPEVAKKAGDFMTHIHSTKIRSGNSLERFIHEDLVGNSTYTVYENKKLEDLSGLTLPCVIKKCIFPKTFYEAHGQACKNKTKVDVDFVVLMPGKIHIIEMKSGCDFDTKKSKGEVQSLVATKNACLASCLVTEAETHIVCYDAKTKSDIIIKTDHEGVEMNTYEEIAEKMGLPDPIESKGRIKLKQQAEAKTTLEALTAFVSEMKELL